MKKVAFILFLSSFFACGQDHVKTPIGAIDKFEEFKRKEKFFADTALLYPGLSNPSMRSVLNDKINLAAEDFRKLADHGNASAQEYRDKIKVGLRRFEDIYIGLDTEDRERVCAYFEELMDIVGA